MTAYLPLPKRFKDYGVSFRPVKLQKFGSCRIQLCCQFGTSALLTHGQPSALKRSKSAFLLVGHGFFVTLQATACPKKESAPTQEPQSHAIHMQSTCNACFVPLILRRPDLSSAASLIS
jgi:hypothetical protein